MLKAMEEVNVKLGIRNILARIEKACEKRNPELQCIKPQLVAVSKTKPVELIIEAYEEGQRHFGENYAKELIEKANHPSILEKCKDIRWHFIGNLQSNKVNKLVNLSNLYMIETLDEEKLAVTLNKSWSKFRDESERLKIMIQVNTSGENEKNGVEPSGVVDLTKFVLENCPNLEFDGIMTIGKFGYNLEDGPNPDFLKLKECRDEICQSLGLDWKNINLSMGMSDDFEHAIELGSTNVRVGSSIFGYRPKKIKDDEQK